MGKFSYHSSNPRNFRPRSTYPGVSKRKLDERQRQRVIQILRKDIAKEMYDEAVAAAAAAAENGPSPAQSLRRAELLAKKADYLKKFTAIDAKRKGLLDDVDTAWAHYEKEGERLRKEKLRIEKLGMAKLRMEKEYRHILVELDFIPAELSSSRMGLSETGEDIMEEVGGNAVKKDQEGGRECCEGGESGFCEE